MSVREVDCMACRATGVVVPLGVTDDSGITHYVRWRVRGGCFRLCDFNEDEPRPHAPRVDPRGTIDVGDG